MNTERDAFLLGTTSVTGLFTPAGALTTGGFETHVVSRDIVSYQIGFWAQQRKLNEQVRASIYLMDTDKQA